MSELRHLLRKVVTGGSRDDRVALLLSAGIDSVSTGIACEEVGKEVRAYTYELKGYRSRERDKVEKIAQHLRWPLKVVTVPSHNLASDFKRLAIEYKCQRKVLFEVLFPILYVFPEIEEREVWTGFNADDHYGNTREPMLKHARLIREGISAAERKRVFDEDRQALYKKFWAPGSGDSFWFARAVAVKNGKDLLEPYMDATIRDFFAGFDHDQLSPFSKPIVRQAFADRLDGLADVIAKGVRLQIGGQVDELFLKLLADTDVNRFETKYTTTSALCQRWGREVEANPAAFAAELAGLPPQPRASVRVSQDNGYRPYVMADVRKASRAEKFTVVSTFAGGGGSSTGYRLAGGKVLLVNEFVPEAAHTYKRNFPDCIVDSRDIRDISTSGETVAAFLASAGLKIGDLDVLDGSPPCSEFSFAGRGIGDQDVQKAYSDVTQNNIASLPFDLVDVVIGAKPKVFVCENVPALASPRSREVFERILHALRIPTDRAYYANWQILTASDFGVPQKRQRLFIIGIRKDVGDLIGIDSDDAVSNVFPAPTQVGVNVRSAFNDLAQSHDDVWPWTRSAMVGSLRKLIRLLPKNPPKPIRLAHVIPGYTKNFTLTRCSWDKPAPTMVVSSQRPDGMTGAIHPRQDRKFTLPELKRLTGLPDDFILTGSFSQASERICRMVPPLLTKAIAESIYKNVLKPYKEKSV